MMTLEIIKTKFLTNEEYNLSNSLTDTIADLETHYQGTSILRAMLDAAMADGVIDEFSMISGGYISSSEDPWADRVERIGLVEVTGEPQEFDLVAFRTRHHIGIYLDGAWHSNCARRMPSITEHAFGMSSVSDHLRHGSCVIHRFSNA